MNSKSIDTCYAELWDKRTGKRSISIQAYGDGINVRLAIKNNEGELIAQLEMNVVSAISLIQIIKL